MIGQKRLLQRVDRMVAAGFPRFTIISGGRHSGKTMLAKYIANALGARLVVAGIKVDEVREVINLAYKQSTPTLYLLPDTDRMSQAAKNALLKITEEPPRRSYFIMTLQDMNNTLLTLKSRGTVLPMDPYSPQDLLDYAHHKKYDLSPPEEEIVCNICTVPGDVDLLVQYDILEFYQFIQLVVDNIGIVNGSNAFKICQRLKYKEDDEGWDIRLFMYAIMYVYRKRLPADLEETLRCKQSIAVTSKYLSQLQTTGINKSSTMDMWVLELRGIWIPE